MSPFRLLVWTACSLVWMARVSPLSAQILPPIYKPLPVEEAARFLTTADSLRAKAGETLARAAALEGDAQTVRQNGTGVVARLREEARRLGVEAGQLEQQASADRLTAVALRSQAEEFARRAAERSRSAAVLRAEIRRLGVREADGDSVATRVRELDTEVRADSQTAQTFAQQARELAGRAAALEAGAESARLRARELRQQQAQLAEFAEEITSGRSATAATAARLEQEATELRGLAERLTRQAREQAALAEEYRVQAGRRLLPVRSRADAQRFYGEDGRSVLRNLVFSLGETGNAGTVNSELVSDYAGPVRIGVGFVLAEARRRTADAEGAAEAGGGGTALERFYAGGGNLVVYATLPLLFHRSGYHSFTLQTLNKLGLDVSPGRGSTAVGNVPANVDLGLEAYGTFNTFGGKIKAFGLLRSGLAAGNQRFHANLGREEATAFPYAQLTFGAELASMAKVLLSGARGADGLNRELSLTFQVAPNRD